MCWLPGIRAGPHAHGSVNSKSCYNILFREYKNTNLNPTYLDILEKFAGIIHVAMMELEYTLSLPRPAVSRNCQHFYYAQLRCS